MNSFLIILVKIQLLKTSETPLDNSKFIGTDWLYLKRTDINIDYSSLVGSTLTFKKTQKGEYIKFYSDGNNYYIIEKNDTNNNINNIITSYPSNNNFNYIVNINKTLKDSEQKKKTCVFVVRYI